MTDTTANLLLIIADSPGESLSWAKQRYAGDAVWLLCFDPGAQDELLPQPWRRLEVGDLLDTDAVRRDFLEFLDAWPRRPLAHGKSFDEMFRRPGGYSLWWTGPGIDRLRQQGVFAKLEKVWVCDRAIKAVNPGRVLIHTRQDDLAWALASRCRNGAAAHEFLSGSATGRRGPFSGRPQWVAKSLIGLLFYPCYVLLRAVLARLLARTPPQTPAQRTRPTVVIASALFRYFGVSQGRVWMRYWRELCEALGAMDAGKQLRFLTRISLGARLLGYRGVFRLFHTGWRLLGKLEGAIPIRESHLACTAWLEAVPAHLTALLRYYRLERTAEFRRSFTFAGADVSPVYVPRLRGVVAGLSQWAHTVGATVRSLRSAGDVQAVLVAEEVYHTGQIDIAAAARLGIPTIGVQHGAIMPVHLMYRLPPGQVQGGPMPDYFAVYSQYAKETLSLHGSYPAERIWITGDPRFDRLVRGRTEAAEARRSLGLPAGKRIVLVATQDYPWFPRAVEAVFAATRDDDDCLVCIKTHPRDVPLAVYRRIAEEAGAENVSFFDRRFDELLAACDVLIGASSTTVLEAILLGRRTICVNFSHEPDWYPYVADGGSLGADSQQRLRQALQRLFREEAQAELEAGRQRFLKRHAGPTAEGKAADTFARMILWLCHHRPAEGVAPAGRSADGR